MPRPGWVKPVSDRRLSDLMSVGVLTRVFPPALVDEVIAATDRQEQRHLVLPARLMAYFAIGMALYTDGRIRMCSTDQLTGGMEWVSGEPEHVVQPSKSAIFQARSRLGEEPVKPLFGKVAAPERVKGCGSMSS